MTPSTETPRKFRRSKKLIEPRIQIRFGLIFLAMAGLAAMVQSIVMGHFLTDLAAQMRTDGLQLKTALPQVLGTSFVVTFCMLAPLMIVIGIRSTFKIVGPLYRFRIYLQSLLAGPVTTPCRIRKDDELQDFCSLLNQVTAPLRGEAAPPVGAESPGQDPGTGTGSEAPSAPLPSAVARQRTETLS